LRFFVNGLRERGIPFVVADLREMRRNRSTRPTGTGFASLCTGPAPEERHGHERGSQFGTDRR
jgi:hypothetical protein